MKNFFMKVTSFLLCWNTPIGKIIFFNFILLWLYTRSIHMNWLTISDCMTKTLTQKCLQLCWRIWYFLTILKPVAWQNYWEYMKDSIVIEWNSRRDLYKYLILGNFSSLPKNNFKALIHVFLILVIILPYNWYMYMEFQGVCDFNILNYVSSI